MVISSESEHFPETPNTLHDSNLSEMPAAFRQQAFHLNNYQSIY